MLPTSGAPADANRPHSERDNDLLQFVQNTRKRLEEKEGGFTLVELLVVIVILGILAAIVVFAVGGITNKGQTAASSTDKSVLSTAEEAYFASTSPAPVYATETNLIPGYLHAASTISLLCLSPSATAPTSYTVIAMPVPAPTTQAAANTACGSGVGSMGIPAVP